VYAIHQAACDFSVPNLMLQGHYHDHRSKEEAHAHECHLSEVEEGILMEWIVHLGHQGVPM
ncbi:hypothetical protein BDN71DRAFT_1362762, partial [Pleurotus eryngii]